MLDFLSKLFILLVGFGAGFFLACVGAARIVGHNSYKVQILIRLLLNI